MLKANSLTRLVHQTREVIHRFPLVVLFSFISAACASYFISAERSNEFLERLFLTSLLGISFSFALVLYRERRPAFPKTFDLLGVVILSFYFWSVWGALSPVDLTRFSQLFLVTHLLVAFLPFVRRGLSFEKEGNGFWQLNRKLFIRFFEAYLYAFVFFSGISLAICIFDFLILGEKVPVELYLYLGVFSAFGVHTLFFLGGVPKNLEDLTTDQNYPRAIKIFTQYLLVPLVSIYCVILYVYGVKLSLSGVWPKGIVSWLVIAISILSFFTYLFLFPFKKENESQWIQKFYRFLFLFIIPLLGLLFVAVGIRIANYGITPQRYLLVCLAVWILGNCLYFTFSSSKRIQWIPISLCILALGTAYGPWGAYQVSEKSQFKRLKEIFRKNDLLTAKGERIASPKKESKTRKVSFEDRREVSSILDYLGRYHGVASIQPLFESDLKQILKDLEKTGSFKGRRSRAFEESRYYSAHSSKIMDAVGMEYISEADRRTGTSNIVFQSKDGSSQQVSVKVSGYDYYFSFYLYVPQKEKEGVKRDFLVGEEKYHFEFKKGVLRVFLKNKELASFNIQSRLQKLRKELQSGFGAIEPEKLAFEKTLFGHRIRCLLQHVNAREESGELKIHNINGALLIKHLKHQ